MCCYEQTVHSGVKPLSFDCCAMSLAPFETPVCTKEGVVFDILNVMPYVKKHKRSPITGEA
jgi:peptidyl-prolyl cis-trans isomerase-like 2